MIVKLLGAFDLVAAIAFFLFCVFHIIPVSAMVIFAILLLIKGIAFAFLLDVASILDIICSVIFFLALSFTIPIIIVALVSFFLIQKGFLSMM